VHSIAALGYVMGQVEDDETSEANHHFPTAACRVYDNRTHCHRNPNATSSSNRKLRYAGYGFLTPSTPQGLGRALGERRRRHVRVIAARLRSAGRLFPSGVGSVVLDEALRMAAAAMSRSIRFAQS
jgi:hypothetical protein